MADLTSGSYVERLAALRDLLAERLLEADPRDTASIARQLAAADARLDALTAPEESDGVDEVARKREARRATAAVGESS